METLGRSSRHAENAACEGIDLIVWYAHGRDYSLVDQIRKQTAGGVAGGGAVRQPGEPGRVLRSAYIEGKPKRMTDLAKHLIWQFAQLALKSGHWQRPNALHVRNALGS